MTTALVFPAATAALVRAHVPAGATVFAVDAGAEACLAAGIVPRAVVGDMDSVRPETLARLEAQGASVHRHPAKKRDTDGALTLAEATDDDLVFVGAGGGRADHAFANLHLLYAASRRARVRAVDVDAEAWVATPTRPVRLALPRGAVVSVLPLFERCEGVTLEGLQYPLADATMPLGDPYGVSNVASAEEQEVRLSRGTLLVIAPRHASES